MRELAKFGRRLPAIFLDRDGVIIEHRSGYVRSISEVSFIPGVFEGLLAASNLGVPIVIVTNQSCVGRGVVSVDEVDEINAFVSDRIEAEGGRVDGFYVCPHHPEEGCACRKPEPGLLLRAAREMKIDLPGSVLFGDNVTDIEAADAAGATPLLVLTGLGQSSLEKLRSMGRGDIDVASNLREGLLRLGVGYGARDGSRELYPRARRGPPARCQETQVGRRHA